MRVFKVTYAVETKDQYDITRYSQIDSERFTCKVIDEAIAYGERKAKELKRHFAGVCELKS